jgi:adenylate cyclase
VDCAVKIQNTLGHLNTKLSEDRQMQLRIGIDLGEILIDKDVTYGDGVNIASRLEGLAEPGGICISEFVYTQVHNKLDVGFVDIGTKKLKNILARVRVYKVIEQKDDTTAMITETSPDQERSLPLHRKPPLAELPFVNLSSDTQQAYFSDGLTMAS